MWNMVVMSISRLLVLRKFNDYIDVIYPNEREIKDTTYAKKMG